jgi:hypothetical protein
VVLGPALGPGYVLSYDMVFAPSPPAGWRAAGLGDSLPRAVPQDLVVALLSQVVPGSLLQALALAGAVFAAAWGAALLVPTRRTGLRLAAATLYGWNAFVAERLVLGHWGLLLAYAALPWIVRAALDVRAGRSGAERVVLAAVPAALTPTGSLLALVVVASLVASRVPVASRRASWTAVAGTAALTWPWVVAGLVSPAGGRSDPAAVDLFAMRSEGPGGLLGTVAGLGGIWNAQVVPASRSTVVALLASLVVTGLAVAGARVLWGRWPQGAVTGLTVAAAACTVVAVAGAVPGPDTVLRALVATVPGAGLLRDGHKFLAPLALLLAITAPLGVERALVVLRRRRPGPGLGPVSAAVTLAVVLLPLVALPDLAWGALGRLQAVRYPAEWDAVAARVAGSGGTLVTLPYGAFRAYPWNGGRVSLDLAARYLDVPVVVDDALPVARSDGTVTVVDGEDPVAGAVRRALDAGAPLVDEGVRWALVQTDQPGAVPDGALAGMRPVWTGSSLVLYEATSAVAPPGPPSWTRRIAVALAHSGLLVSLITATWFRVTRKTPTRR